VKWIGLAVALMVLGVLAWIRLAPDDAARWHTLPEDVENSDMEDGVMRRAQGNLATFHEVAMEAPRTKVLAGSVDEGMVTYVVRSRLFGFPDYVTAAQRGSDLAVHSRLRYGQSDMGVNKARMEAWLARMRN
jgi:hypothetical protein